MTFQAPEGTTVTVDVLLQEQCHRPDEESEWICPETIETLTYTTNQLGMVNGQISTGGYEYIHLQVKQLESINWNT